MAGFAVYRRLSENEIREMGQNVVAQATQFFANNPKRRVARAGVWYGKLIKVRRNHVQEDVDVAVAKILVDESYHNDQTYDK